MKTFKKLLIGLTVFCATFCCACNMDWLLPDSSNSESITEESVDGSLDVSNEEGSSIDNGSESVPEENSEEENSEEENSEEESSEEVHTHSLTLMEAQEGDCLNDGNIAYYTCDCGKYFADVDGLEELTAEQLLVKGSHKVTNWTEEKEATCTTDGNIGYYTCDVCGKYVLHEDSETVWTEEDVVIKAAHGLGYHEATKPSGKENGTIAHYSCVACGKYFLDDNALEELTEEDLVVLSAYNIPDFVVEVEAGRDPVVLQLSDPQLCNWGNLETYCYQYIRETVQETNPDLIIITGDLVYGRFDPDGKLLQGLIGFMESLQIPWAPVFGNHDNESLMGVDWQCAQLEKAEYCLFKQGDLTGNGNYSVGVAQNDELLRVFYMMDSNGCGSPMCNSNGVQTAPAPGTNVVKTSAGFGQDQIDWYTDEINAIHATDADVKISFAYHIQQAIFEKAFKKYSEYNASNVTGSALNNPLNLDKMENADDTDFGYVGRVMKGAWDTNYTVFNGMKALGVDSIFVGHEHCNSSSIVYQGVRFQFSQKSSRYDRYNTVSEDGTITGGYDADHPVGAHLLMGGTVIPISSTDGSIGTGYIYYAGNPFYFEPKPVELPVNGLKLDASMLQSGYGMTIHGTTFDDTVNAYKIYSEGQGKIFFDTALAMQYDTFTYSVFIPADSAGGVDGWEYALRAKPDGTLTTAQGCTDGKYIFYRTSTSNSLCKVKRGEWCTITVDISNIEAGCTEFSLMFSANTTVWIKDVAFTDGEVLPETEPEEIVVEGLQFGTDLTEHVADTVKAVRLEDGTTAYEYVAKSEWNKLYICQAGAVNANALKGKKTISFDIMLPTNTTTEAFALRIKPNPTAEQVPNINNGYLYFDESYTGDRKVVTGEWKTVTIDISSYADVCTEFAIYLFAGTTAYVRNITIS